MMKYIVALSGLALSVFSALANPIPPADITVDNGALAVDTPKGDNGLTDSGDGTVFTWLSTYDVPEYDSLTSATLPTPIQTGDLTAQSGWSSQDAAGDVTFNLTGTYDYLFLHWGGPGGGVYQAYFIAGLTGDYTFDNPTGLGFGTISFDNLYKGTPSNTVPDGGSTIALLGVALIGLAGLRAKFQTHAANSVAEKKCQFKTPATM